MKRWMLVAVCFQTIVVAQPETPTSIRGLRVVGASFHGLPITVAGSTIKVEFDDTSTQRKDYRLRIRHCDKDGVVTASVFINDPMRQTTMEPIVAQPAPVGIRGYRWTYAVTFPGPKGLEEVRFSGFYKGWIVEQESGREVATFDFICGEQRATDVLRVRQRSVPSMISPYDEGIVARMTVSMSNATIDEAPLSPLLIQGVDVVKNREWSRRTRIETYDRDPNTWIEDAGTESETFVAGAILPGNEYRQLDVRNIAYYPRGEVLRSRAGADVSRFFFPGRADNNGVPSYASGLAADYEEAEFQLAWDGGDDPEHAPVVHVVGEFNGWSIRPEWRMDYDAVQGRYTIVRPLRRAQYDYQYVYGDGDWVKLEGNSWTTRNVYTALVIYRDPQFGGFDRIIHVAQSETDGKETLRGSK